MSQLREIADDYLRVRRSLGYKLGRQGRHLAQFVAYLDQAGASTITIEHAITWATLPAGCTAGYASDRLSVVRQFAVYLATIDATCEVPPKRLLPSARHRPVPHIYTPDQVSALMAAAGRLRGAFHRATMATLIGLLAVTGMRLGEAIGLGRDDLDSPHRLLRVIDTKFAKSREVALHPTALDALTDYAARRDELCPTPSSRAFFVSRNGTRLLAQVIHRVFARMTNQLGLTSSGSWDRPRLHDLRHTFAVNTILGWHTDGLEVQARLPLLSTYLGHVEPASTYHYLTATPQLLEIVAQRLPPRGGS